MIFSPSAKYQQRIDVLETEVSEKDMLIMSLKKELVDYKRTIAAFSGVKAEYESLVEDVKNEYSAKVEKLEKEIKVVKKSVANQVNMELASIGIPIAQAPKDETDFGGDSNPAELLETLTNLSGNERTEYYKKNEEKITHALQTLSKLNK